MDLSLLHKTCKLSTRKAFDEYKRQIDVALFPFNETLHINFKIQMFQDIVMSITKTFINNYKLSNAQLKVLNNTINHYKNIAEKTANNYSKRFL